ncbi:tail fiber assembly protein [Jejubacter calystegiae]|uniref:Tail fiber assembly protein n=1 Tax=Jejubacter calystegiae TaxID=2579935 RepID=A0A4V1G756_9ENTR|nr:tail fiber assembly protein [Jejubacter calystegiae]QCT18477.1 tail fiber assembly protein [Jejubacter calystegiae]
MKIFNDFSLYYPEDDALPDGVLFLRSDNGADWYEVQQRFSEETLKVVFDNRGVICSAEKDASGLWPLGCSVVEVDADNIPAGFAVNGQWQYAAGKITPVPVDNVANAEAEKARLLSVATASIAPLQDAIDLDIATDEEAELLKAWKKYRVLLNRVDTSVAPDIEWPEVPGNVA